MTARLVNKIHNHQIYTQSSQIPFRTIENLGRGAFGIVDKVEGTSEPFLGQIYARKTLFLPPQGSRREKMLALIQNEVEIVKQVRHSHIVSLIGTYASIKDYAIIMDPVAEENLEECLARMDESPSDNIDLRLRAKIPEWFGCLVNGVAYLHGKNIRHRDIKPSNILIMAGNILLTDFGISFEASEETILTETITGGTPQYRAPEANEWIRSGRPADIFSLGAVFLEMLTVYTGNKKLATFRDSRGGPYASKIKEVFQWMDYLGDTAPDIPWRSTMLFLCRNMLQPERERRPAVYALRLCWSYYPFSASPSTSCKFCPTPNDFDCDGVSEINGALRIASKEGHMLIINLLIERGAVIIDSGALGAACGVGREEVANVLIQKGADVNSDGALHKASGGGFEAVVQILLEKGAFIETSDNNGWTALHEATQNGHEKVVQLLLGKGVNIGAEDHNGMTALHCAARKGHNAVVQLLLENKADVKVENENGMTALLCAAMEGHESVTRLLIEKGSDIKTKDNHGRTALHWAAERGHEPLVRLLTERGASIEGKFGSWGLTALHLAAINRHSAVVRLLLEKGANIDAKDADGKTALHVATENGDESVVQQLLDNGANVSAKDSDGVTAFRMAEYNGHEALVQLLLGREVNVDAEDTADYNRNAKSGSRKPNVTSAEVERLMRENERLTVEKRGQNTTIIGLQREITEFKHLQILHAAQVSKLKILDYGIFSSGKLESLSEQKSREFDQRLLDLFNYMFPVDRVLGGDDWSYYNAIDRYEDILREFDVQPVLHEAELQPYQYYRPKIRDPSIAPAQRLRDFRFYLITHTSWWEGHRFMADHFRHYQLANSFILVLRDRRIVDI